MGPFDKLRSVRVTLAGDVLRVSHAGDEVAVHVRRSGRCQQVIDPAHFAGVVGFGAPARAAKAAAESASAPALLRPLSEYERLVGGGW
ncbi:MAG TPA: hypothetical protein VJ770_18750 [Stellaceae bacterium]|nr:hypothetical protein [Stellaceae bacterium]